MRAPGRHRAPLCRRHHAHDGRAEHRAALGARSRPAGALRRAEPQSASATPGAQTIVDVTACPGTDTCKLGIASSRGLGGRAAQAADAQRASRWTPPSKACTSRSAAASTPAASTTSPTSASTASAATSADYQVPHFQVVLGGKWADNAGSYGLPIGAVPSKRIPDVVDRLTERYVRERQGTETFQDFCQRIGKKALKQMLDEFTKVPAHGEDAELLHRLGRPARVHDRRHGHRRVRRRSGVAGRVRPGRRRARALRGAAPARGRRLSAGGVARLSGHGAGGESPGARRSSSTSATSPTASSRSSASASSRPNCSTRSSPAASSRSICCAITTSRGRTASAESAHQLIEEASLFVEAGHACQLRLAQTKATPAAAAASQVISLESLA